MSESSAAVSNSFATSPNVTRPVGGEPPRFIVASPIRTGYYNAYAKTLSQAGLLKFYSLGTRRGAEGVPLQQTRLNPWFGLLTYGTYLSARALGQFYGRS